ncbi:MAG: sterol desaturase family protein [Leptospiraceae bacterium]|nr:sterol desaturase family protein [Leptospiraceae bacterium]MCK6382447.1 sterol desaturase family protein [Leptospiraceae bacterium]NUM41392.1 sterol desaturase family protein [Leptospiraceae bacterium]
MNFQIEEAIRVWGIIFFILTIRYVVFAGIAYLIFWVWKKKDWEHKRIQIPYPDNRKIINEFYWSMSSMFIFAFIGLGIYYLKKSGKTLIYSDINEYGIGYFWFSIIAMIIIHDTYFYWAHRFMHIKPLYKFLHNVHHLSVNPSPWASFSFQPTESFLESIIVLIFVFILPVHSLAIMAFMIFMTFMNVLGHLGFELYPKNFVRHWFGKWHNTATHHNMHHKYFHYNYGLYFNFWDRVMGTNHPKYFESFDEIKSRKSFF